MTVGVFSRGLWSGDRFIFPAKNPLGFHNFSRTPNPWFYWRIDEFLVVVVAFLGSPNPLPSTPPPPPTFLFVFERECQISYLLFIFFKNFLGVVGNFFLYFNWNVRFFICFSLFFRFFFRIFWGWLAISFWNIWKYATPTFLEICPPLRKKSLKKREILSWKYAPPLPRKEISKNLKIKWKISLSRKNTKRNWKLFKKTREIVEVWVKYWARV